MVNNAFFPSFFVWVGWGYPGRASCDRNDFLSGLGWIKYLIQNIPKHEQELQEVRI
jgi:hypothetical protein